MEKNIKIGVVGSGAVGTTIATKLTSLEYDVEYVYDRHTDIEIGNMRDLNVVGETEPCSCLVKCINSANNFTTKKDIIFLVCKSTHISRHIETVKDNLTKNGFVVLLNNMLVRHLVTKHIDIHKIVGMLINWSCEKENDNTAIITQKGSTMIGAYSEDAKPLAELVCKILLPISNTVYIDNFSDFVLGRVILNSALASIGALCGQKLGDYMLNKYARKIFVELIREGYCVFKVIGITPTDYDGHFDYDLFIRKDFKARRYQNKIMKFMQKYNANTWSSILKDLQENKSLEIDYMLGQIIKTGAKNNIDTIFSKKVYQKIVEIKANNDTIRPELLKIIWKGSN